MYTLRALTGELSEWPKEHDWKSCKRLSASWFKSQTLRQTFTRGTYGCHEFYLERWQSGECGGLENRLPFGVREFESHPLRQAMSRRCATGFSLGVAMSMADEGHYTRDP